MSSDDRDGFEVWMIQMDDVLEEFTERLSKASVIHLDYSVDSLRSLEGWLLSEFRNIDDVNEQNRVADIDAAARYVGEVIRKQLGARWFIQLDEEEEVFHGLPQVEVFGPVPLRHCPLSLVTASLDRRTGDFILGVVSRLEKRSQQLKQS